MSITNYPGQPGLLQQAGTTLTLLKTAASAGLLPWRVTLSRKAGICFQFPPGTDSVYTIQSWGSAMASEVYSNRGRGDDGPGPSALIKFTFDKPRSRPAPASPQF